MEEGGEKRGENESASVLPERSTDTYRYFDVLTTCLTTLDLLAGCRGKWVKGEHGEGLQITTKKSGANVRGGQRDGWTTK